MVSQNFGNGTEKAHATHVGAYNTYILWIEENYKQGIITQFLICFPFELQVYIFISQG